MSGTSRRTGEFTGWHMLAIMVVFFGIIIAVNLTMAVMARRSWTGTVVENTYVASQQFNARAAAGRAQDALGWQPDLDVAAGIVTFHLRDATGAPVEADLARAYFRHPAYDSADREALLARQPDGTFMAAVDLPDGQWIIEIDTDVAGLELPYRVVERLTIADGAVR